MWLFRESPGDGAADAAGGEGPAVDNPGAAVTTEEDGEADPLPDSRGPRAAETAAASSLRA